MIDFMGPIGLYDRCIGSVETRGIYGTGPWHPKAIRYIRAVRARTGIEPPSDGLLSMALWAINENAQCQLDDVQWRAQTDCARLSSYIDDITRLTEYDMHRARFTVLVAMPSRLEAIRVSTV